MTVSSAILLIIDRSNSIQCKGQHISGGSRGRKGPSPSVSRGPLERVRACCFLCLSFWCLSPHACLHRDSASAWGPHKLPPSLPLSLLLHGMTLSARSPLPEPLSAVSLTDREAMLQQKSLSGDSEIDTHPEKATAAGEGLCVECIQPLSV